MIVRTASGGSPDLAHDEGVRAAYAQHGAELFRFALRGTGDRQAAEDVVQETFLRAWRARDRYDPRLSGLRVWLFSIARNVLIDLRRADDARPWQRDLREPTVVEGAAAAGPDEWEPRMRRWVIEEALQRLNDDHRTALVQTYLADRGYDEVAAELGIPASTLRSRVFYGLKALRVAMDEMGVTW